MKYNVEELEFLFHLGIIQSFGVFPFFLKFKETKEPLRNKIRIKHKISHLLFCTELFTLVLMTMLIVVGIFHLLDEYSSYINRKTIYFSIAMETTGTLIFVIFMFTNCFKKRYQLLKIVKHIKSLQACLLKENHRLSLWDIFVSSYILIVTVLITIVSFYGVYGYIGFIWFAYAILIYLLYAKIVVYKFALNIEASYFKSIFKNLTYNHFKMSGRDCRNIKFTDVILKLKKLELFHKEISEYFHPLILSIIAHSTFFVITEFFNVIEKWKQQERVHFIFGTLNTFIPVFELLTIAISPSILLEQVI